MPPCTGILELIKNWQSLNFNQRNRYYTFTKESLQIYKMIQKIISTIFYNKE